MIRGRALITCLIIGGLVSLPNACKGDKLNLGSNWDITMPGGSASPPIFNGSIRLDNIVNNSSLRAKGEITLAGGSICPPIPNNRIRLDSMVVTIRLKKHFYVIDAVFHLFNTGDTTLEWVGLPKHGDSQESRHGDNIPRVHDFTWFEAWIDGRKVNFEEKSDFLQDQNTPFPEPNGSRLDSETRWMVKQVSFAKDARTTIHTRYAALYDHPQTSVPQAWGYYYYGTARYWKDEVGKAVIIIDGTNIHRKEQKIWLVSPPGPRVTTDKIQIYEKGEFEPPLKGRLIFGPGTDL